MKFRGGQPTSGRGPNRRETTRYAPGSSGHHPTTAAVAVTRAARSDQLSTGERNALLNYRFHRVKSDAVGSSRFKLDASLRHAGYPQEGGQVERVSAGLPSGATVQVGKVVELTRQEQRELEELSEVLRRLSRARQKGWFLPFVQTVTRINRLIHSAVGRSHAS